MSFPRFHPACGKSAACVPCNGRTRPVWIRGRLGSGTAAAYRWNTHSNLCPSLETSRLRLLLRPCQFAWHSVARPTAFVKRQMVLSGFCWSDFSDDMKCYRNMAPSIGVAMLSGSQQLILKRTRQITTPRFCRLPVRRGDCVRPLSQFWKRTNGKFRISPPLPAGSRVWCRRGHNVTG